MKSVSFSAVVVHKSIHFVFSFVLKYITFSAILFVLLKWQEGGGGWRVEGGVEGGGGGPQ